MAGKQTIIVLPQGDTILTQSELTEQEYKDIVDMIEADISDLKTEIEHYLLQRNHNIKSHVVLRGQYPR